MRPAPLPSAYRPQAFSLAGEPQQLRLAIRALREDPELRRRLQAGRLILRVRPPRRPRVFRWQSAVAPAAVVATRRLAAPGVDLPEMALLQFEVAPGARARGIGPAFEVPDMVEALRGWLREKGITGVEACPDQTFTNPAAHHNVARSAPEHIYNSPEHIYNSPEHIYNSPDLVAPDSEQFPLDRQPAFERIGWDRWRGRSLPERGQGVTVVILDSWPVFVDGIDFDASRADLFVDYDPPVVPPAPFLDEEPGCSLTERPRMGRYNANLARRLLPYHGPLCASLVRALAPEARIIAVRVLDNNGNGYASIIGEAIRWVMSNPTIAGEPLLLDPKRVVFNMSLGVGRTQAEIVENCCLFYTIHNACLAGASFACAVGNESTGRPENPVEPAAYGFYADSRAVGARVFPVAGTAAPGEYAFFSNESHLAAPSVDIIMDPGPSRLRRESGGANVRWRGTSFATPLVTSTLALLLSRDTPPEDLKQHLWEHANRPRRWHGVAELNLARALSR